jgi:hypothetical protein
MNSHGHQADEVIIRFRKERADIAGTSENEERT